MQQPLAYRMRPNKIEDIVGQQHLVGSGKIIWRMVAAKRLSSMILYGPPGTGKTSIASAIAGSSKYAFRVLNAATDSQKDLQIVAEEAKMSGTVVLLLDEIHRLNKVKQDFLLPHLESGAIILIGATTENPYINVTPAIRSRTQIFQVTPLTEDDVKSAVHRALKDDTHGLGKYKVTLTDDAMNHLAQATNGDLRSALNGLELAVLSTPTAKDKTIHITLPVIEETVQRKAMFADKDGDAHYDVISALQKSIRGSDTDAALHYAARIIESGDLPILTRRLTVIAYEDIGLANPTAVQHAVTAIQSAQSLGLPEARIPLANAIIELALSPKSNAAYLAIDKALSDIQSGKTGDVPDHLRDSHYKGAAELGHGKGYIYPHDFDNDWVPQQYLPEKISQTQYFSPKGNSKIEKAFSDVYQTLKKSQRDGLDS
ncbi:MULTISPECIES: replication-associated recombination protein A [Leuconostoc]|uniref:replication-associated recombination protein A n=1 Tax=Leuconostoc TaxID=1243 RepID=UPI0002465C0D|nr:MULTISPECIES: replication-associated recombination protein A [Leuconostoc]KAF0260402.1 replication-associated recombination protein A [Leuconostoc citreum]MBA5937570.1 replication-associated recombination protein A [Leuconostoc citreum]MBE4725787.1 replication-associated recombination protein A [Leuconostoc citreum]MCJ2167966.1 replication-associated recombination protein A [Leuconostoc citreum]MCP1276056.1 replication-associated recombination protein A [Leuconostoc citreum]